MFRLTCSFPPLRAIHALLSSLTFSGIPAQTSEATGSMSGADVVKPENWRNARTIDSSESNVHDCVKSTHQGIKLAGLNFYKYGEGYASKPKYSRPCLYHEVTSDNRYGAKTSSLPDWMALPRQRCGTCDSPKGTQPLARSATFGRTGPDHMRCVFVRTDTLMLGLSNVKQASPPRVRSLKRKRRLLRPTSITVPLSCQGSPCRRAPRASPTRT